MVSRTLLLLFTVTFAAQLGLGLISPLLPIYAQDLGASGIWLGIIFAVFSVARFVAMPIVGRYSDVYGRRRFIIIGLATYAIISLGYIAANSAESLTAIRFAHGISSALVVPVAMAYTGDIAPKGREGRYMGLFNMGMFMGIGCGPLLGGVFADAYGMDSAFITMGALALLNLVFVLLMLPESNVKQQRGSQVPYRAVLADRTMQAVFVHRTVNAMGQGMVMSFLPIYAVVELDLPLAFVGLIISSQTLTIAFLQGPGGIMADRYSRVAMVMVGGSIFAVTLLALPLASDLAQLLSLIVLGAVGSAFAIGSMTAITTSMGRVFGMGTLMGVFNSIGSLGRAIGPLLGGIIFDAFGISELFYVGGACSAASLALFLLLMKRAHVDAVGENTTSV